MKYLNKFQDHSNYVEFIVGSKFAGIQTEKKDTVSYCINQNEVHYNPYVPIPKAKLLDILYSDDNGNLSFTSEVLPPSEGKTPIALCIAEQGFFGNNEPTRWMSIKRMNYNTPDTGSLTLQTMYYGNYGNDISKIDNIQTTYINGSSNGYITANWIYKNNNKIPSLFNVNNEWNLSELGTVNQYAVTDIDGKNKTDLILKTVTSQSTWQTDTSITNNSGANYAPAACCCWRYHTLGTNQGDWYLGACGEMSMILANKPNINTKLTAINTIYPNDCINSLGANSYLSSTEYSDNIIYVIFAYDGKVDIYSKANDQNVIALLQY